MDIKKLCRLCLVNDVALLWVFDEIFDVKPHLRDIILKTTSVEINPEDDISQNICQKCGSEVIKLYKFRQKSLKSDTFLRDQQKNLVQKKTLHPSIIKLFHKYPRLQVPNLEACVTGNVDPVVEMPMNEVENYFSSNNINFQKHVQQVFRQERQKIKAISKAKIVPKEIVSPINIKFIQDKSQYEIVEKTRQENHRKRQSSESEQPHTSKRLIIESRRQSIDPNLLIVLPVSEIKDTALNVIEKPKMHPEIISNILLKPAESTKMDFINYLGIKPLNNINPGHMIPPPEIRKVDEFLNPIIIPPPEIIEVDEFLNPICIPPPEIIEVDEFLNPIIRNDSVVEHFDCEYCRETFVSNETLKTHLESCYTRKALEIPSYVFLEKLEDCEKYQRSKHVTKEMIDLDTEEILDIHPSIRIKQSRFPNINYNLPAKNILDNLLAPDRNHSPTDQNMQTDLTSENPDIGNIISAIKNIPKTDSITKLPDGVNISMNNLKPYLEIYKIPVNIHLGPEMEVKYNLKVLPKTNQNYKHWKDLTPKDVKPVTSTNIPIDLVSTPDINLPSSLSIDDKIKQLKLNKSNETKSKRVLQYFDDHIEQFLIEDTTSTNSIVCRNTSSKHLNVHPQKMLEDNIQSDSINRLDSNKKVRDSVLNFSSKQLDSIVRTSKTSANSKQLESTVKTSSNNIRSYYNASGEHLGLNLEAPSTFGSNVEVTRSTDSICSFSNRQTAKTFDSTSANVEVPISSIDSISTFSSQQNSVGSVGSFDSTNKIVEVPRPSIDSICSFSNRQTARTFGSTSANAEVSKPSVDSICSLSNQQNSVGGVRSFGSTNAIVEVPRTSIGNICSFSNRQTAIRAIVDVQRPSIDSICSFSNQQNYVDCVRSFDSTNAIVEVPRTSLDSICSFDSTGSNQQTAVDSVHPFDRASVNLEAPRTSIDDICSFGSTGSDHLNCNNQIFNVNVEVPTTSNNQLRNEISQINQHNNIPPINQNHYFSQMIINMQCNYAANNPAGFTNLAECRNDRVSYNNMQQQNQFKNAQIWHPPPLNRTYHNPQSYKHVRPPPPPYSSIFNKPNSDKLFEHIPRPNMYNTNPIQGASYAPRQNVFQKEYFTQNHVPKNYQKSNYCKKSTDMHTENSENTVNVSTIRVRPLSDLK